MKLNKKLPSDVLKLVKEEVLASYELDEIKALTWEKFWWQVDAQNTFEEEWGAWLNKGIKGAYKAVFNEIKNG